MSKIGILGPLGTYTEQAAFKYDKESELVAYNSIEEVFSAVESGKVSKGVVPIENRLDGHITRTLDLLYNSINVKIIREVTIEIAHYLGGLGSPGDIKKITSKREALNQCRNFFSKEYKDAELVETTSTAAAAEMIAKQKLRDTAAVGSEQAMKRYGLNILAKNIGDKNDNTTRFVVIGKEKTKKTGKDITSIAIHPKEDLEGLLGRILGLISGVHINLDMIQSRPDGKGRYIFYMDLEGHEDDENVSLALKSIRLSLKTKDETALKVLGSYPEARR